jgi:hypothetical protein
MIRGVLKTDNSVINFILPEKLTVPQLVTKFSAFYGTPSFVTVFKSARHLFLF